MYMVNVIRWVVLCIVVICFVVKVVIESSSVMLSISRFVGDFVRMMV